MTGPHAAPDATPVPGPRGEDGDMTDSAGTDVEAGDRADERMAGRAGIRPVFARRMGARRPDGGADATGSGRGVDPDPADSPVDGADDEVEDLGEDPTPFTFPDSDEGLLDEETLREIVADVVRQELQGALGQRITRNVRKMVRREIRIALAAEDLD